MSRLRVGAGFLLTLTTAAAALAGCTSNSDAQVKVAAIGYGTVAQVVQAPANIVPKAQVVLSAAADGTVARLAVQDGQHVAAGQVLAVLSSPAARQQLAEAKKAADQAAAAGGSAGPGNTVQTTGAGFTRAESAARDRADRAFGQARQAARKITDPALRKALLDQIAATQSSYDAAISAVDQSVTEFQQGLASASQVLAALGQAQQTQAQAAVDVAQRTVDALTVTAPISGIVTLGTGQAGAGAAGLGSLSQLLSGAGAGSAASALGAAAGGGSGGAGPAGSGSGASVISVGGPVSGGGSLFTITDASSLSVTAQVDETDVLAVKPGVSAHVQLNAVPGADYQGTVTAVDPNSTTSTQGGVTYTVRISLARGTLADGSTAPAPLPGMSAIADLDVLTVQHALSVPSAALVTDGSVTSVWLVSGGVVHKQPIQLGAQGDKTVQVLGGLNAGDRIVVAGADKVADGDHVG
ncbi:efflux RND transporter periplasmic adaptor subunit [Actinocrinis puniceicyclus]|uniref:Efflux RND transporter periplasmic adaptor subunit n=1 Tax=Actinocrinis puniceicyclus TaxID=977794 RepID=A0A8J8BE10_9ACTN|nr:efflux RND transporter periplasmic adaptor subunit [Actinocrinis puniceicyclus]MBS2965050.1 efflux RND transporter periplasmic adaptor subunit [Actinocrinis puniceicyclus]